MKIENVNFFTSNGIKLSGNVYFPDNVPNPANKHFTALPAIILCQGLSGVKNKVLPEIATLFSHNGYIVLAFDYRGFGESEGDRTRLFPEERVDDILHAIAYMQSYPNVDQEKVGLYGLSYGAAGCLAATALAPQVKCVVAVSGAVDGIDFMRGLRTTDQWIAFKKLMQVDSLNQATHGQSALIAINEIVPFTPEFWQKYNKLGNKNDSESIPASKVNQLPQFSLASAYAMTQFNISAITDKLSPRPVLIIHGEVDNVIAIEDVMKVYNKINTKKDLIIIENCDHIDLDHGPGLTKQINFSLQWFDRYLR